MAYLNFSSMGQSLRVSILQWNLSKLFQQLVLHKASSDHVTLSL